MARHSSNAQQGLTWREVTLPIMSGVDLRANARAIPQVRLARLINGSFDERNAVGKRAGHVGGRVIAEGNNLFPWPAVGTYQWLYGHGRFSPSEDATTQSVWRPLQDQLKDVVNREGQISVWTGDRLFSYDPNLKTWHGSNRYWDLATISPDPQKGVPLYAPSAKVSDLPSRPDQVATQHQTVRGLKYLLQAWLVSSTLWVRVTNEDGTVLVEKSLMAGNDHNGTPVTMVTIGYIKCIYLGGSLCIFAADSDTSQLWFVRILETDPTATAIIDTVTAVGDLTAMNHWDCYKVDDNRAVVAYRDVGEIKIAYVEAFPGVIQQPAASGTSIPLETFTADGVVAVAVSPSGFLGFVWASGAAAKCRVTTPAGADDGSVGTLEAAAPVRVTCCHLGIEDTTHFFVGYAQVDSGADPYTKVIRFRNTGTVSGSEVRWNVKIAGSAFTVGNEPCVTMVTVNQGTVKQATYVLQIGVKNPRVGGAWGRHGAGLAALADIPRSADFLPGQDKYNRTKWILSFTHNPKFYETERLIEVGDAVGMTEPFTVQEQRGLRVEMDFLPDLTWAPFGRSVYFSGAQPHVWDGKRVTEAGFLQWPDYTAALTATNNAGAVMTVGDVKYRVYFCRKNQWGEVSRSPAITSAVINIPDTTTQVNITLSTLEVTEDEQVYYEIYRTQVGPGPTYRLISGIDVTTALKNDRTVKEVVYVDTASDTSIARFPVDPHNPVSGVLSELDEVALPGCTVLASANDRLWFAGGEVPPGKAFYSKIKEPGEQAAWNDQAVLEYTVDNSTEPITAIGDLSGLTVLFRENSVYRVAGDGPDNTGAGSYPVAQRASSDLGALNQKGVVRTPDGLAFWSSEGPRILTEQLAVAVLGDEVTPAARNRTVRAALLSPRPSQVRWYLDNGTALVYDYITRFWGVHTGLDVNGACFASNGAVIVRTDAVVMFEDSAVKTDAGRVYEYSFKTSELRPSELVQGSNRCRRWAASGVWKGSHDLKVNVYYDGSPYKSEEITWDVAAAMDDVGWGEADAGVFGTTGDSLWPSLTITSNDGVYRTRRRFRRQRFSTVALEFSDNFASGDGFVITEVALEVGSKDGLTRLPGRSFT